LDYVEFEIILAEAMGVHKRVVNEIRKVQEWQSENKFILESWSHHKSIPRIHGGIFPEREPYCFASFLIEIAFPFEYPFQPPETRILDAIYHPRAQKSGQGCSCWYPVNNMWRPTTSLIEYINIIIDVIDNFDLKRRCGGTVVVESASDYEQFYEKALRCTFDHGRPRF
jgi:ubiquitin-protein ligase